MKRVHALLQRHLVSPPAKCNSICSESNHSQRCAPSTNVYHLMPRLSIFNMRERIKLMRNSFVKMMSASNMRVFVVIAVIVQQCFNLLVHMLFVPVVIHGYEAAGRKCHWLHFSLRFFDRTLEKRNMKKRLFISPEVLLFFSNTLLTWALFSNCFIH